MRTKLKIAITTCLSLTLAVSCSERSKQTSRASQDVAGTSINSPASSVGDFSVKKCIHDGYSILPVLREGIPESYLCKDPTNGKTCDSWDYYRGECFL